MSENFIPQYEPRITEDHIKSVSDQMRSGWVGPSKTVDALERKICDISGASYCAATTSGTTALILAIASLNIPAHSTILFPSYTFLAGANAARFLGYKVRLIDIKEDTLCMDPDKIDFNCIGAIMFVNHNGYVGEDVAKIKQMCCDYKVPMIEDSSQALGIKNAGRIGDVGVFSFSVPKIVTTGQGGVVFTDNEDLYDKILKVRDHGNNWRKLKLHNDLGVNFKFNDISASYGMAQLNELDNLLFLRKQLWDWYREGINIVDFGYDSTWMVIYRTKFAEQIINELKRNNIQAVQYYRPIVDNPPYSVNEECAVARKAYEELVYLPSSLVLTKDIVKEITGIINKIEANK